MSGIINTILSVIIAVSVSTGAANIAETTPEEAMADFFHGISSGDKQLTQSYIDNQYVNFLENVKGSDEEMEILEAAVFGNLKYEVTETRTKGTVAVSRVKITNKDFSKVMDDYEKASYKYVMDNLYDESAIQKEKLNVECVDIYVEQIKKAAETDSVYEKEILVPMEDDGYSGWRIVLSDEIMQATMGGLELPVK